jgi:hypothetical protein
VGRFLAVLGLAFLALDAFAQTYSVDINPTLNGLDVAIEPVPSPEMLVIKLTNRTETKVRCKLRYDAAPQTPFRTTTNIGPGRTESSVFRARRLWHSVSVDVDCKPATQ